MDEQYLPNLEAKMQFPIFCTLDYSLLFSSRMWFMICMFLAIFCNVFLYVLYSHPFVQQVFTEKPLCPTYLEYSLGQD